MISEISFLDSLMVALILSIFSAAVSSKGGGGTKSSCQPPPLSSTSPPPPAPSATKFDEMGFRLTGDSFMFCYFDWTSNFSSIFFRCVERRRLRKFSREEGGGSRRAQIIRSPISSRRALWSPSYSGPCLFREPPEDGRQLLMIVFARLEPLPRLHNLIWGII